MTRWGCLWQGFITGCYPQSHHGQPLEAVVTLLLPPKGMWINLWKLWIAVGREFVADPLDGCLCTAFCAAGLSWGWIELPLGWSGDPGVLPVRHSVERARAATRVVSPLSRGADGPTGGSVGRAAGQPAVEYTRGPAAGQTAGASRLAAHAAAAAGLPLDSGAPRRRAAPATRTTTARTHPALRRDTALELVGPR